VLPAPVAVVGSVHALYWAAAGPIAPIIEAHGIKVGDGLYSAQQIKQLLAPVPRLPERTTAMTDEAIFALAKAQADEPADWSIAEYGVQFTGEEIVAFSRAIIAQARAELIAELKPAAYLTRDDDGDPSMLFFDRDEACTYCDEHSEPEALCVIPTTKEGHEDQ
jgi:hypothetical protein